jgi:hypothetical protein
MSDNQIPQMNAENMYLDEVFTDQAIGQIRRLTPVNSEGAPDTSRKVIFMGSTQFSTPAGPLPVNFEIEAETLSEAIAQFSELAQQGAEDTIKRLEEMRRDQASKIVVPGQEGNGGIQMP